MQFVRVSGNSRHQLRFYNPQRIYALALLADYVDKNCKGELKTIKKSYDASIKNPILLFTLCF